MRRLATLTSFLALVACGDAEPDLRVLQGVAPLWISELDLPGCEAASLSSGELELWAHPLDRELLVVAQGGNPTCIGSLRSALQFSNNLGLGPGMMLLGQGEVDDVPIPLVRENDHEPEENPPPQPPVRPNDVAPRGNPIPLVRPGAELSPGSRFVL